MLVSDNPNLIYAILRSNDRLHALATFTLPAALAEIAHAKAAKEEHLRRTGAHTPDQKRSTSPEQSAPQTGEDEGIDDSAREEKDRVRDREQTLAANAATPERQAATPSPPSGLSEKARGKLRARTPSVGSLSSPAFPANASNILGYESSSGFVATEEWVQSWVQGLPLDSILIAISEVGQ
jgi:High-temperature-induced dauer-formation protein